jgi:hypothetical protein
MNSSNTCNNFPNIRCLDVLLLGLLLILIPVWNIPHTMAIRNITAGLLLILVIFNNRDWLIYLRSSKPLIAFSIYLLFFILFISSDQLETIKNINSEWLKFILYSILGGAIGLHFAKYSIKKIFLFLGFCFAIPLLIHIGLFSIESMKQQTIPWGYAGLSLSHGDLGYSALQGTIFLSTCLFFFNNSKKLALSLLLLIGLMLISVVIARSRGGLIFIILSFMAVAFFSLITTEKISLSKKIALGFFLLLALFAVTKAMTGLFPDKWKNFDSKVRIGLMGNPISINCNGAEELKKELLQIRKSLTADDIETIHEIDIGSTASRIVTARAGLTLLTQNPWGINASREAYRISLQGICVPKVNLANTHNGWLDSALGIGVAGALILLSIYINNIFIAVNAIQQKIKGSEAAAAALFVTSFIWIFRNFLDAAQRDQMLEMQGLSMALLAGILLKNKLIK